MSLDRARMHLTQYGLEGRVQEFDQSSATVELAAKAVGCEPARIAKTLSFVVGDRVVLILFAGDARINNQKFKARFHTKPKMLPVADAESRIGHAVGGVCPFGVSDECDVYLDVSLRRFDVVYPAAGSSSSAVRLSLDELERACHPCEWVDVSRLPE
ncbi:MAG: YbaK/EbsC family protein [Atopobiaceae bacterium]|nr:YbaK/EbsC family protein [Atopobiaceae bacterium]